MTAQEPTQRFDLFISHASEDKTLVARPLAAALAQRGWRVWLDELELTIGDSLNGRVNSALATSHFGVVVLSPAFFAKAWPMRELDALAAREVARGSKVILPVWHEIDHDYLLARNPVLADRLGAETIRGIDSVAEEIDRALHSARTAVRAPQDTARLMQAMPSSPSPSHVVNVTNPRGAGFMARLAAATAGGTPHSGESGRHGPPPPPRKKKKRSGRRR